MTFATILVAGFVGFAVGCAAATAVFLALIQKLFPLEDEPR